VRNLERSIGTVCRRLATKVARREQIDATVNAGDLEEYLGPPRFDREVAQRTSIPGVATGLAYTPVGGEIIFVEASIMPGRGSFIVTGQLGSVMQESAQAALSIIRSRGKEWGIPVERLAETDIHVHVPAGAIPKDGPSAGVAMLTALFTLLTQTTADPLVGMTGEITLRGLVLPVGGIKEKLLAAHRAGLKKIILPARNQRDLYEVPEEAREALQFVFAERVEDVLFAAVPGLKPAAKTKRRAKRRGRSSTTKSRVRVKASTIQRRKPSRKAKSTGKRTLSARPARGKATGGKAAAKAHAARG
jgi:ATP-dependent Lon protease